LALYWAKALANQNTDQDLKTTFTKIAQDLSSNETAILTELNAAQGKPVDLGGYYHPDFKKVNAAMRPSEIFNTVLDSIAINA